MTRSPSPPEENNAIKAAIRSFVIAVLTLLTFTTTGCSAHFNETLQKTADDLNAQRPMQIDSETQLDNVLIPLENHISYTYTLINYGTGDLDASQITDLESTMNDQLIQQVRSQDNMKTLRDHDVVFEYQYNNKDGGTLFTLYITPDDYKQQP